SQAEREGAAARRDSSQGAAGKRVKESPEGADVIDVVGNGDVLVRRVIGGRGVARAESSGGNPKGAANRRQRSRPGEQRIDDGFGAVGASAGGPRGPPSNRAGGTERRRTARPP